MGLGQGTVHTYIIYIRITFCSVQTSNKRCSFSPSLFGWLSSREKRSPRRFWQLSSCTCVGKAKTVLEQRHRDIVLIQGGPKSKMPVSGLQLLESSRQICWLARMPLSSFHKTWTSKLRNSAMTKCKVMQTDFCMCLFASKIGCIFCLSWLPDNPTIRQKVISQGSIVDCRCYVAHPKPGEVNGLDVACGNSRCHTGQTTWDNYVSRTMSSTLARNVSTYWTIIVLHIIFAYFCLVQWLSVTCVFASSIVSGMPSLCLCKSARDKQRSILFS